MRVSIKRTTKMTTKRTKKAKIRRRRQGRAGWEEWEEWKAAVGAGAWHAMQTDWLMAPSDLFMLMRAAAAANLSSPSSTWDPSRTPSQQPPPPTQPTPRPPLLIFPPFANDLSVSPATTFVSVRDLRHLLAPCPLSGPSSSSSCCCHCCCDNADD